ncbi:MAG TPA: AIPR family protein [Candidatus Angelobacter sp.]|nr:AIPR family protein [Candidatus Angelobacter sp.]
MNFSTERGLSHLPEDKRFENFATFITVGRHYTETFDTEELLVGTATGIDAIAIIVNGNLITDTEELDEELNAPELDVAFIFVQADRSANFDVGKLGNIGFATADFFKETPTIPRNAEVAAAAEMMSKLYRYSSKFRRGNPICRMYYVTTGNWMNDQTLEARRQNAIQDLQVTNMFREVTFECLGADGVQRLYRQTKNAISRDFFFRSRVVVPEVAGVKEAYLGFLPMPEFWKIISDDNGEMIGSLFYSNPRDWQEYNDVNEEIKTTLQSPAKARFVLMNNGITIIARDIRPTGDKFTIEDYQIVNGCQTSHVLFEQASKDDASVMVPVRLIGTQDDEVINTIIKATNRQTPVTEDQFFALQEFPKQLEAFFQSFETSKKLYYERRSRQYERLQGIEKTRIITQPNVIKAFAAMFLDEAHRTSRNYGALKAKVGREIFGQGHKKDPYYTASLALWRLEYLFRNSRLDPKFKPARFHILLAVRMLAKPNEPLPAMNSRDMERYCAPLMGWLWDTETADALINAASSAVDKAAAGDFDRDKIRTEPFTKRVIDECKAAAQSATAISN